MTELKEKIEYLIANKEKIPDEFWVQTENKQHLCIWLVNRQKPSIEQNYDFDEERFGITIEGKIIWGFDSGCSCPIPWSSEDFGNSYNESTSYKEFITEERIEDFDKDWQEEALNNLSEYLLLVEEDVSIEKAMTVKNTEIKEYILNHKAKE